MLAPPPRGLVLPPTGNPGSAPEFDYHRAQERIKHFQVGGSDNSKGDANLLFGQISLKTA